MPTYAGWSGWVIYFRLSGSGRTADEADAFLRDEANLQDSPQLADFALCYVNPMDQMQGWVERFSKNGIEDLP